MSDVRERVYLVGSIPLSGPEEVFQTSLDVLDGRLRRIPDGETNERRFFIDWHIGVIAQARDVLEWVSPPKDRYPQLPFFRLREGADPKDLKFGSFGYADWAERSYAVFSRMKDEGRIPGDVRFQVNLPLSITPVVAFFADPETMAAVEGAYEAAILAELAEVAARLPASEIAIQADIVFEIALWERMFPPFFGGDPEAGVIERVSRFVDGVPADAELGFHMCYGDYQHKHFKQPDDLGVIVAMLNAIVPGAAHPLEYVHMPVPRDREDPEYFAPLADLRLDAETELYLGLVHHTDGVEGTRRRIAAAETVTSNFGIATECGFGRRPAETIPELLHIHNEVAAGREAG